MRTSWNDDEDDALQGLPLRAQIVYLRGLRRYMDYASRVSGGPSRRISLGMLAETVQECVNRQLQPKASKDGIRAALEQLKRAGLARRLPDPDYLVFHLPLADADPGRHSALGNHPPTARPPARDHQPPAAAAAQAAPAALPPAGNPPPAAPHRPTHQTSGNQELPALPDGRAAPPGPPYQAIVSLYHDCLPQLPRVYRLTDSRRRQIRALWGHELDDLDSWRNYFRHVSRSDFLMGRRPGRDGAAFQASFDFIIHPGKFIKIAEDQYHDPQIQDRRR